MNAVPVSLEALTVEELKALRRQWYEEAAADGSITAIGRVVRELGARLPKKHGANWVWMQGDVRIVLDDWTGHTYVSVGERQVFASNYTTKLFVPGPWIDVVRSAEEEASARIGQRQADAERGERAALLRQLGGEASPGCQACGEPHGVSIPCGRQLGGA